MFCSKLKIMNKRRRPIQPSRKKVFTTSNRQNGQALTPESTARTYDMLVFSHLHWDFVYQRPQHIIDRMSKYYRILFIEEPMPGNDKALELREVNNNLSILRPSCNSMDEMEKILRHYVANKDVSVGWFY